MTTPAHHVYRRDKTGTACAYAGCALTPAEHHREAPPESYRVARVAVVDVCVGDVTAARNKSAGPLRWRGAVADVRLTDRHVTLVFADGSSAHYPDDGYVKIKIARPS